jgi:hypothetical protein
MESSRKPTTRRLRAISASAGVILFAVAAVVSGCYYRGRPPEYGHRGYSDHRHDGHDGHDRRYER